jgi:hypothetical protein
VIAAPRRFESTGSPERGVALALAVFALAVIGALVGGIFFAGRLEQQSGLNVLFAAQAGEAAEAGLSDAIATLAPSALQGLSIGGAPLDLGTTPLAGGTSTSRQVIRLTATLFLIRARGVRRDASGGELAVRSLGLLVRLDPPVGGAADSGGPVQLAERGWVQLY